MIVELEVPRDFSLGAAVYSHGWYQTDPFTWNDVALDRIDRMRAGGRPHLVRFSQNKRQLRIEVVGARRVPDSYLDRVRRIFQLDLRLAAFHRAIKDEKSLTWIRRAKIGRILGSGDLFEDLVKTICGTNVQWRQAVKMANTICTLGPTVRGRHAFPSPEEVEEAGADWLRANARTGYRSASIATLAQAVSSGDLDLDAIVQDAPSLTGDELRRRLVAIRGVGPSSARFLSGLFGKLDVPVVDSAVIACAKDRHFGGQKPTVAQVEAYYTRFGPHAGRVAWFETWNHWVRRWGDDE